MKKKVTRDDIVQSIIKLFTEYREVEEDSSLGYLGFGLNAVEWMFDWLSEEYSNIGMKKIRMDEIKEMGLIKGTTIGDLANIALEHVENLEYDDGNPEESEKIEQLKKTVTMFFKASGDGPTAFTNPQEMTKEEFLKNCADFYDARGTHCNDYELMQVKID